MDSFSSVEVSSGSMTLTAKPHAFAGAILTPKHARELTPSLCLAITSALAEQAYRKDAIPYTSWITEAWRVLGWSEPRYGIGSLQIGCCRRLKFPHLSVCDMFLQCCSILGDRKLIDAYREMSGDAFTYF